MNPFFFLNKQILTSFHSFGTHEVFGDVHGKGNTQ